MKAAPINCGPLSDRNTLSQWRGVYRPLRSNLPFATRGEQLAGWLVAEYLEGWEERARVLGSLSVLIDCHSDNASSNGHHIALSETVMSTRIWDEVRATGVSRAPAPLTKGAWNDLYTALGGFADFVHANSEYGETFDAIAKEWQAESGLSLDYGGYFSPYYRNLIGKAGKDNKIIYQTCQPYVEFLWQRHPELMRVVPFRRLIDSALAALYCSVATYLPLIHGLNAINPDLATALVPEGRMPSVALRLLRYYPDSYYYTNPHTDKSAVTLIADSDEPTGESGLVFAPRKSDDTPPPLSEFKPVPKGEGESLVFMGAAPREAGFDWFEPAPHAVRPLSTAMVRHVAIIFWLLPGTDLANFDTAIPFVDDVGLARPSKNGPRSGSNPISDL